MKSKITQIGSGRLIKLAALIVVFLFVTGISYSQVAINSDNSLPAASAMLDVKATGMGLLAPRMTFANRPAAPATGLIIYQTDSDPGYYYYDGAAWQKVGRASDQFWMANGLDIYFNTGNVGVGTDTPDGHGLYSMHYVTGKAAVKGTDESGSFIFADGMLGVLSPSAMGVPTSVFNVGVLGVKPDNGFDGAGVLGWTDDTDASNYGGLFIADGSSTNTNNAIYADADSASINYAGYFKGRVHILANNNLTDGASDYGSNVLTVEVNHDNFIDTRAVYGISTPVDGYGYGVYGEGGYRGTYGFGNGGGYTGTVIGVYGYSSGTAGTRVGLYGYASGGTTNWAAQLIGSTYISGDLRIGTTTAATGYALSVNGNIACEEVLVQDAGSWPDYVFHADYNLMSLEELESSIKENNHLPGLPPAVEVEANGFNVADMQKRVLEKVEELTLYTIEQGKLIQELQNEVKALKAENTSIEK
ncbi:MAG: hypothetical protein K9G76_10400 [Bacteroidales bacterium]|nr:hypothetical protein [Bacteroidales bacterium]MCF8405247.1 hypothetical protein [Bacteroidales bacterium]